MEKTWEKPRETRGNESLWSYHVTSQHFKKYTLKFSDCIFLHCSFWSKDSSYGNGNKAPWDLKWMDHVTFLEGEFLIRSQKCSLKVTQLVIILSDSLSIYRMKWHTQLVITTLAYYATQLAISINNRKKNIVIIIFQTRQNRQ